MGYTYKTFSFEEPWLSKSSINLYERCPYAFYLRQVLKIKPGRDELPEAIKRGTKFHDWAENIYDKIDEEAILNGDVTVGEEMRKYSDGSDVVENFIQMEQNRWQQDPTETFFPKEREIFLTDEDLHYFGSFDRLDMEGDDYVVCDYKTGKYKDWKLSGYRFELYGYKHLIEANYDIEVPYGCLIFPDSKKIHFEEFKSRTGTAFYKKVDRVRERILDKKFPQKGNCAYCFMSGECAGKVEQVE